MKGGSSMNRKIYTTEEVAEMLKLDPVTIRRFLRTKKLRGLKFGRSWRIEEKDLIDFIESSWNIPERRKELEEQKK
jgi:excisionase family DNA binding protein